MPHLKHSFDTMKEVFIDRFYGVGYPEIKKEYGVDSQVIRNIIYQRRQYKSPLYFEAFEQALKELDVDRESYIKELEKHAVTRSLIARKNTPSIHRSLTRKQVYEILSLLFKKPSTSAEVAHEVGVDNAVVHRIRHQESYKEITVDYIRSHRIQNPERYLSQGPTGRGKNGYPILDDDAVRRFFYSYISGASRQRAMSEGNLSTYSAYLLLSLKHPKKTDLMKSLIISEGFTPSTFLEYVRKKGIRSATENRKRLYARQRQAKAYQER